ncbi:aspartate/glutamate racemase family protein [Ectobacillus antri]|jgi:aspartate racemase|uniref:aspartate/glutamate racemase family protein n=1 Tax=Ectobacillus antri TaxID=2486280 RepID=UPI000F591F1F|nr:amino acid racemase [Ectobacillus antri]
MKTIGMIGGLSWESTSLYSTYLNEFAQKACSHCAPLVIQGMDFTEVTHWLERGDDESLTTALIETAQQVEEMGADCLLLCSNTVHIFANEVAEAISIPLLHISDASAEAIRMQSINKIGVLGTKHTLKKGFYLEKLESHGLQALCPSSEECTWMHNIIMNELSQGILSPKTKADFQNIIQNLIVQGAEGILLACTEIPLLITQEDVSVPLFDTAYLHAQQAISFALQKEEAVT